MPECVSQGLIVDDRAFQCLSNAVERTADHILITDAHGTILYTNPAFERLTGYTRREAYGHTPRLLKSGKQDSSSYRGLWSTLLAGNVFRGTFVNRKKSGQLYSSGQTITPMRDDSGDITHFVSVGRDLTEREAIADRDGEMRLAGLVQSRLYPPLLRHAGIDIAGSALPANATGGDYYDYLHMSEGRLGIVVADVSGHGLGAALIMVATRAALRSCADIAIGLDEILDHVNTTLVSDLEPGRFVTMCLASLDTRARTLTYSNAGHPSGYVLSGAGEIKGVMESTRIPLGVMSDWKSDRTRSIPLERGDLMVFLTDGVLESTGSDGRPFGVENVLALVREHRHEPAQRILEQVLSGVQAASEGVPQEDDMTAVICKVAPGP
jgi:sigma-B regulation protein RsbU (phosphoserine phosphatase)